MRNLLRAVAVCALSLASLSTAKSSVKFRALMLLLAVTLVCTAASSSPFDGDCYTVNPQFCEYYSGGWCRSGCFPECSGDVSGEIWYCWQLPQECCY